MKTELQNIALDRFFDFYKKDIESEIIDANNVVISFPVHFSGFHRIEVTVTRVSDNQYIISDGSKVLDELRAAGYLVNAKLLKRIEDISKVAGIRAVKGYLVSDSNLESLGSALQRFVEAAKTIGDAYLVQKTSMPRDMQIVKQVSDFLSEQQVPFMKNPKRLSDRQLEVLRALAAAGRQMGGPVAPMDCGGQDGSFHSAVLTLLCKRGLAGRKKYTFGGCHCRCGPDAMFGHKCKGSFSYWITEEGRLALESD